VVSVTDPYGRIHVCNKEAIIIMETDEERMFSPIHSIRLVLFF
jgi:hypothetical protein